MVRIAEMGDSSGMSSAKFVTLNLGFTVVRAGIPELLPLAPCPADPGLPFAEPDLPFEEPVLTGSGKYEVDWPEIEGCEPLDCGPDTVL